MLRSLRTGLDRLEAIVGRCNVPGWWESGYLRGTVGFEHRRTSMERSPMMRVLRRVAVVVGGGALLAIGVAMIVLPGPAVVVIPAAIGVLAIEFEWARRWLRSIRAGAARATNALCGSAGRSAAKAE